MASKAGAEEPNNTETEENTIAQQKKRSRRVSFAETTSIHVFDRDDDYETPPDLNPSSDDHNPRSRSLHPADDFGFSQDDSKESLQNDEETDIDGEDNNDEEFDSRKSFLRPIESPSPGSTIGSAASNDEDNFFGPVSASFIRPGRLSGSAASDENPDITMDSTAFSMHFRSLARSDLGVDLKTPTRVHLSFEEKTPTHTSRGNSMVLTASKKPISDSFVAAAKSGGHGDSNDMSLVGENPHRYDYGRLSPGLDALLAEGSKGLVASSTLAHTGTSKPSMNAERTSSPLNEDGKKLMELIDNQDKELDGIGTHNMLTETVSTIHDRSIVANRASGVSPILQLTSGLSSDASNPQAPDSSIIQANWSPYLFENDMLVGKNNESVKDSLELRQSDMHLSAVRRSTLSALSDKINQLEGFAQHDRGSPLEGFTSSSSDKQRQILINSSSPCKHPSIITACSQLGSFLINETMTHVESASSIQKSISRLNMLEASPFSSTFNAKIENWKIRSWDYLSKTPPLDTMLQQNSKDPEYKHFDASPTSTEEHFVHVSHKKEERKNAMNTDDNGIGSSKSVEDVTHSGKYDYQKGRMSLHHMSEGVASQQAIEVTAAESSPSRFTLSGKKTQENLFMLENNSEGTLVNSGTTSSLAEIKFDYIRDGKIIGEHPNFVSSPEKWLKMISVRSPRHKGGLSRDLGLHNKNVELINFDPGQDSGSRVTVTNAVFSAITADKLDSTCIVGKEPFTNKIPGLDMQQDVSGMTRNLQTPSREGEFQNHSIPDRNLQTDFVLSRSENHFPGGGTKDASCGSASLFAQRIANELPLQQNLVEWFNQSPSRSELCGLTHSDNRCPTNVEDILSPKSNQLTNECGNRSSIKRKNEEIIVSNGDYKHETATIQKSPKLHKHGGCHSEFLACQNKETSTIDHELQHWCYSKFSGDIEQLLPSSVDKLNLRAIHVLEDILVHLQRSKTYEMLSTQIRTQKRFDPSNPQYDRSSEARLLFQKLVHEHAKLQLMHLKKERLHKRVQLLSSGIQESQMLKLNSLPQLSMQYTRCAQVDDLQFQSFPANLVDKHEVICDKLAAMREVLKASERQITNLTKSFHCSCKLKGEPCSADTIALVNDQLTKRGCCRIARLDLQLWLIDSLESTNGHHSIVLNYLGFLIQRLSVTVGPASVIIFSNKLNNVNIAKNFPNMDACIAFAFVLNKETTQKYAGPRHLAQETRITSSLLGNLLDVVEEVQLAQIELRNLAQTSFNSPSVDQLDLKLCFFDLKSGRKAALTFDISCLNRGVYPAEIIPSQLTVFTDGRETASSQPLLAEIKAAIQSLSAGYLRIMRLCRCVSKVVQASTG